MPTIYDYVIMYPYLHDYVIIVVEIGIVGFCIPLHLCGNTAAHALLGEEIHVAVCQKLEFDVGVFKKRVPTQSGACVVVGWAQAVVFEACLSEGFKHVCAK